MNFQPFHFRKLNIYLAAITIFFFSLTALCYFCKGDELPLVSSPPQKSTPTPLPYSFESKKELTAPHATSFFSLEQKELKLKLPDLRTALVSYGINCRPDAPKEETKLLLGIRGQPEPTAIRLNEKAYLTHDPRPHVARWSISPNNSPTPLFLEIEVKDGQVVAHLKMKDHEGKLIEEPYEFAHFVLPEMTPPVSHETLTHWRIGSEHVDGSILQRHKARWFGQDLFLQMYGGDEFQFTKECERLEFEENGRYYNIFIKPGDLIAFGDDGWEVVDAGKQSYSKPLLHVKKIDDSVIAFDLWENDGKMKLFIELRKSPEPPFNPTLNDFKLVGARSRKDWIAEISGKRELVRDDDWILYSQGKYKRLTKVEDLDNYVEGVIRGELIIFEGVKRSGNEMCLTGVRFNEMRTQTSPVQIPVYKAPETQGIEPQLQQPHDDDDDDDEEEEVHKHVLPNGMRDNTAPTYRPGNTTPSLPSSVPNQTHHQHDDDDEEDFDDEEDDDYI